MVIVPTAKPKNSVFFPVSIVRESLTLAERHGLIKLFSYFLLISDMKLFFNFLLQTAEARTVRSCIGWSFCSP